MCHGHTTDPKISRVNGSQQGLCHTEMDSLALQWRVVGTSFGHTMCVKHYLLTLTSLCNFQVISAYLGADSEDSFC